MTIETLPRHPRILASLDVATDLRRDTTGRIVAVSFRTQAPGVGGAMERPISEHLGARLDCHIEIFRLRCSGGASTLLFAQRGELTVVNPGTIDRIMRLTRMQQPWTNHLIRRAAAAVMLDP